MDITHRNLRNGTKIYVVYYEYTFNFAYVYCLLPEKVIVNFGEIIAFGNRCCEIRKIPLCNINNRFH